MRVLMIVRQFYPWIGGTERQAQKLAAKLIELGIDTRVVTGWWFWETPRQEIIETIPIYRNFTCWGMFGVKGLRKFGGYLYILSLFWYLWKYRDSYDLIHIHLLGYPAFPGVLAGRWLGKKSIVKIANSGQGSDIRRMQQNDLLPGQEYMLPIALGADHLVAINEESISELRKAHVSPERISIIPNGVAFNGDCKIEYGLDGRVTIVFVGRLHPNKGLDILLPAFKKVICERPTLCWQLWLFGDGPLRSELELLANQLGIAAEVKFWGWVDNPAGTYRDQADIFVLPSRTEGVSNALLEAMAYGVPCVATRIGGNTDLIRHHENGLLINPDSEADLVEALLRLVDDVALRQNVGILARQTVEDEYSIDSVAERYIKLYHMLYG